MIKLTNNSYGDMKNRLLAMRRELLNSLENESGYGRGRDEELRENISELSSFDSHLGDLGTEQFEREKDLTLDGFQEEKLFEIETALTRMERGDYGKCQKCGAPINSQRLQAIPYARYCFSCSEG